MISREAWTEDLRVIGVLVRARKAGVMGWLRLQPSWVRVAMAVEAAGIVVLGVALRVEAEFASPFLSPMALAAACVLGFWAARWGWQSGEAEVLLSAPVSSRSLRMWHQVRGMAWVVVGVGLLSIGLSVRDAVACLAVGLVLAASRPWLDAVPMRAPRPVPAFRASSQSLRWPHAVPWWGGLGPDLRASLTGLRAMTAFALIVGPGVTLAAIAWQHRSGSALSRGSLFAILALSQLAGFYPLILSLHESEEWEPSWPRTAAARLLGPVAIAVPSAVVFGGVPLVVSAALLHRLDAGMLAFGLLVLPACVAGAQSVRVSEARAGARAVALTAASVLLMTVAAFGFVTAVRGAHPAGLVALAALALAVTAAVSVRSLRRLRRR